MISVWGESSGAYGGGGCGAADVSSLDFFAGGSCEAATLAKWRKTRTLLEHQPSPSPHHRGERQESCTRKLALVDAPPSSAARGCPMQIFRCGYASEAWRARASRTSSEQRPMDGPTRTSGRAALDSPERPRPLVHSTKPAPMRQKSHRRTSWPGTRARLPPQRSGKKLERSSSTRRPLRLFSKARRLESEPWDRSG